MGNEGMAISSMSSKRHIRRSKCERKIQYRTAGQARAAARRFCEMGGDLLNAFPCSFGSHWHLGHAPNRIEMAVASKMAAHKARRKIEKQSLGG
jgi:hypothetical protein